MTREFVYKVQLGVKKCNFRNFRHGWTNIKTVSLCLVKLIRYYSLSGQIIVQKWVFLSTLSIAKCSQLLESRYAQVIVLAQRQMSQMSHIKKDSIFGIFGMGKAT